MIVLDLDHTLVYATYDSGTDGKVIFSRKTGLRVLERPFAKLFVQHLQETGMIVVYTSALAWYARKIMKHFGLTDVQVFSRSSCRLREDHYRKSLSWIGLSPGPNVTIVDDSPQFWNSDDLMACNLIAPSRWMGAADDRTLISITTNLTDHIR